MPLFIWLFVAAAALYLPAVLTALQVRLSFAAVLVIALQLRVPMFLTEPTLSDDVWRYLHDGRAQHAGVNPYLYAPADARTAQYRGPEYANINHPNLPTIYPPVAQYAFRMAAASAAPLFVWRLMLLAAEVATLIAGALLLKKRGLPPANLALYAWHPLAIIEGIGSAHLEPLGIAFLVVTAGWLASGPRARAGAALALSVATKLVAAPLLMLQARHARLTACFALTLLAVYLPFMTEGSNVFGSLRLFSETWESNGSIYALVAPLLGGREYRLMAAGVLMLLLAVLAWYRWAFTEAGFAFFFALFLFSPVVHPWYLLWLLAFLPFRKQPFDRTGLAALLWTCSVVASYSAHQQQLVTGTWHIPANLLLAEYVPVYLLLISAATSLPFSQMKLTPMIMKNPANM